jgi:hypothetical protein
MPDSTILSRVVGWGVECAEPLVGLFECQNPPHTLGEIPRTRALVIMVEGVCTGVDVWMAIATADVSREVIRRRGRTAA